MSDGGNGISLQLGRIEGSLAALDKRMDHQDALLEACRAHQEEMGVRYATCQGAAARREQRISAMEKQVRAMEVTGVVQVTGQRVRRRTLATLGAVAVSLVSAMAAIGGMKCNGKWIHPAHSVHRDAAAAAKKGR